jgi:hypothetical protein
MVKSMGDDPLLARHSLIRSTAACYELSVQRNIGSLYGIQRR